MAAPFMYDSSNVSDSTDWIGTPLAIMEHVDSALRCQVCKDFYKTPMTTSCLHTFCSICIHRCLASDGQCPACRSKDQASKLKSSWVLEQVVDAFKAARPTALTYARLPSSLSTGKRKIDSTDFGNEEAEHPKRRTRSSNRTTTQSQELVDITLEDDVFGDGTYEPDDGLVSCPVCQKRWKADRLNSHLDVCLEQPQLASSTNTQQAPHERSISKPSNFLQRLPNINYSLMKDGALKKKLLELGISAAGARPLLERRHTEWVIIWNANCDAANPRKKRELLHDLETWERAQGSKAATATVGLGSKEFDRADWAAKNGESFQSLIASARRNVGRKTGIDTPGSGSMTDNSAVGAGKNTTIEEDKDAASNPGTLFSLENNPKSPDNDHDPSYDLETTIDEAAKVDIEGQRPSALVSCQRTHRSSHSPSKSSQRRMFQEEGGGSGTDAEYIT